MEDFRTGPPPAARSEEFRSEGGDGRLETVCRQVPVETPVAIEMEGVGYAVMMATPTDLHDFATGFAFAEGLIDGAGDLASIETHDTGAGWIVRLFLADPGAPVMARVRARVVESGCGLCGLESLEALARPLPRIAAPRPPARAAVLRALDALTGLQALGRATGAVHAAAFCDDDGRILALREDVGRHNAYDKMAGAVLRAGLDPATGFALLTSRCSFELVEKSARLGVGALVTISAPTTLALDRARGAGLPLVVLARQDTMLRDVPRMPDDLS